MSTSSALRPGNAPSQSQTTLPGGEGTDDINHEHHHHKTGSDADKLSDDAEKKASDEDAEKAGYGLEPQITVHEGEIEMPDKYKKLGWKKLTICLIVEAIALGSLSIPSAFATLGMVAGVLITVGLGFIAIYTSILVGQVKLRYPDVHDYGDAVYLIWGRFGRELTGVMFILLLVLLLGSHTLTGTIAFVQIVQRESVCALVFGIVSAILLFALALPPSFSEFAILGYIDFVSIIIAIGVTIIATGIEASSKPGGIAASGWSAWPAPGTTLYSAFLSVTDIVFAYSFAVAQFTFMDEMHTPKDYIKSVWTLGLAEIVIYTLVGGLVYAFVGPSVASPALLSAGLTISRVAFGIALPVIFISGAINSTVVGRYIMNRAFRRSRIRCIDTPRGWGVWIALIATITVIAWVIAEAIPFFNALLGIISALFVSGFSLYFPALFWFQLLKEGKWNGSTKNICLSIVNACVLLIGVAVLGLGTYASVQDIINGYATGSGIRSPFTCSSASYAS